MLRVIGEARPRFVVIENVPALRSRGLEVVLGGLSALGYDAEWHCIPAAAAGADHLRDRVWVIAYPEGFGCGEGRSGRLADGLARVSHGPLRDRQERISAIEGRIGQPCLLGSPDGLPHRVDRVFALGNAVVPQIPALIGRALMASYTGTHSRPINDRH
jgi:DNA (cytosine-5)-methyltransferase 1